MTMGRIKTNIIELNKLYRKPCKGWLERFENGKIDAHEAFKKYGEQYGWLYGHSNYDLIGWEIENKVFNWEQYSWAVAKYCSEYIDAKKYNWEKHSWVIAKYCPEHLDPDKYNWDEDSWAIAKYCPDKIDPERYNWEDSSWAIAKYCPEKMILKPKNI